MSDALGLRPYQVNDLAFYMSHPRGGNFSDPGTGKTPSVCVYMGWLWCEKKVRSIWTMPKSLLKKNLQELLLWSGLRAEDIVIVTGTPARRERLMQTDAKVFLMGFDAFARNWERLVELHPDIDCLVADEWHMGFKTNGSQRTQSMYRFMERTTFLVSMTGTLIDGRLDAAYPFIHLVEPYIGGYDGFRMRHAMEDDFGKVIEWIRPKEVGAILKRHSIRHTFAETYGPEARVIIVETCEMVPKQRALYDEFEARALVELEDGWLDGTLPGVNLVRCRQLMEHPQSFGPPLDAIRLTGKEERLLIHLADHRNTGKPLVIFGALTAQHRRIAQLCKSEGFRVGLINGSVSEARRSRIDLEFRAGRLDIVVASPATAGIGFNWGHVDHVLFMSLDYMDSNFVQAYRRAIRGPRKKPLRITVMAYANSVDQQIFAIVERKSRMAQDVDKTRERVRLFQHRS